MTQILLHFTVSFWIDINYRTLWNVVGSLIETMKINTLVLVLTVKERLQGIFFVNWDISLSLSNRYPCPPSVLIVGCWCSEPVA